MSYDFNSMVLQSIKSIISMTNVIPINEFFNEEGFNQLISHFSFPSYSIIDIYKRKEFIRRCKTALNFFIEYPITFSYSDICINFLISQKNAISPKLSDFYNKYILFNYLSWMQNYLRSEDDEDIFNLMKSLLIYPSLLNLDCFFTLYFIVIHKHPTMQLKTIVSLLDSIFNEMKEVKLPDYSYSFLSLHFTMLLQRGQNETNPETFSEEIDNMMNLILKIFINDASKITTQIADDFYNSIKPFLIEEFDMRALKIFTNLTSFLPFQTKSDAISEFPLKIIQYIEKQPEPYISINFEKNEKKSKIKNEIFDSNPKLNFLSSSFNQSKNIDNDGLKIAFFPQITFDDICDKTLISYLAFISKSIASKRDESDDLFDAFFEKFKELIEKRKNDRFSITILGAYLVFCHINEYPKNIHDLTPLFLEYDIWSPEYSIFQSDINMDEFKIINAFRYLSLNYIMNQESSSSFNNFFKEIHKNPIILIEGSERLQYLHFASLIKIVTQEKFLLNTICIAIDSFITKKEEYPVFSLFKLLSKLMKEKEIIPLIYNNSLFLTFFFRFTFEIQLQKYVLEEIKMFLIDGCDEIPPIFIDSFSKLFKQIFQNFSKSQESQELAINLMQTLFYVIDIKPSFSKEFSFIIYPFLNEIGHFEKTSNDETQSKFFRFFEVIFKYFSYLEDIPKDTIEYINGLVRSKLINCDDNLFNLIKSNMEKNNIIVQELLARLLFYCFWNQRSNQIIDLFTNYCKFDSINSLKLHEIEMDSFIIDELKSYNTFGNEEIEKRLVLLEQIFLTVSTPSIVQNLLSLFGKNINYAFTLEKLFQFKESIPISFFPFNNVIENEFQDNSYSFSFTIWVYVENKNDVLSIFHINGNETIKINESKLFVNDSFIFDVPIKKWVFLAFSFTIYEIICSLDTENVTNHLLIDSKKNYLFKYKIGSAENLSGKYGNFGLYPILTKEQILYLFNFGPTNLSFPYFPFYEYYSQNKIMSTNSEQLLNFPQIFIQKNKIHFICPIFGQLNEENYKIITSILYNCLLFDISQQEYFEKIHGFVIISDSMISNDVKYLTYYFYLYFFDLFQKLSLQKLKNSLIKSVLVNFQLWSRSPEFLSIVEHWKDVLFAKNDYVSELIQLSYLLDLMRIFLYYKPIETCIKNNEPIVQYDKIKEIRTNIIEIMIQNHANSINEYGYALLMYHLIDCQDTQQIEDLLLFLENLSKNPSKTLISFMRNTEIYLTLHELLVSNNLNIVMTTLSIISNFRKSNILVNIEIDEMMYIFLFQMINSQINPEILNKIINLYLDDIPELFPFCCCYSLILDNKYKDKSFFISIFNLIEPSKKFVISPIWALWAVYGAIVQSKEEIIFFLIQCSRPNYFYLYTLIDRICELFNFNVFYWKTILISFIADDINNSFENETFKYDVIENFVDLSFYYIFFRKYQRYHNPSLIKLYSDFCKEVNDTPEKYKNIPPYSIPYSDSNCLNEIINFLNEKPYLLPSTEKQQNAQNDYNPFEIINKIISSCLFENQLIFGIRLNEKEVWLDNTISTKVNLIIDDFSYSCQDKFKNSLIYFLNNNHLPSDFNLKKEDLNFIKNPNDIFISMRKYSENALEKAKRCLNYTPEALQIYGQKRLNLTKRSISDSFDNISYIIADSNDEKTNESNENENIEFESNNTNNNNLDEIQSIDISIIDPEEMKKIKKIELIGQGSQSMIYKVLYNKKYLAMKELKVIDDKNDIFVNFKRFFQEFEIANKLNHPNIIKTQGFFIGDDDHPPSILFELLSFNLKQAVNELSDFERVTIIYEISSALMEMHHSNMIHRDLKPENILLDENKHVKVSDFGISYLHDVEAQVKSMTTGIGTLKFMAPELLNENKYYNEKVDVFSFGVVVFFILTKGKYPENTIADVISGKKAPIPKSVNKVSTDLINWCWSLTADERPSFSQIIEFIAKNNFNLIDGIQNEIQQIKSFLAI